MAATLTKQELFNSAMIAYMNEMGQSPLKKYGEIKTQTGGESITFNRLLEATAKDGITSMFDSAFTDDGGDMVAIKVAIDDVSAQMKITDQEMNKTSVDIKSAYVKSLGNAVGRKEDSKITAKLKALTAKVSPAKPTNAAPTPKECMGVQVADYTAQANVKKIIGAIRKAHAYAKLTVDGHKGVALIISTANWADLSTSDYVLNNDYNAVFGGGVNGQPTTFYGAEVIVIDNVDTATESYLVPSNTFCFAEFESSMRNDAVFVPTDKLRWHLQSYKSVGVEIAEAHMITKLSATAPAALSVK